MTASADATGLACSKVVKEPVVIRHPIPQVPCRGVALHAVLVFERSCEVNLRERFVDVHPHELRQEIIDVPHAAELGQRVAEHAVVLVADVAALVPELVVAGMDRGKADTVGVFRVLEVPVHGVATSAERVVFGRGEAFQVQSESASRAEDNLQALQFCICYRID